jgi:phosphotransferase system HPr (HPr) family protein
MKKETVTILNENGLHALPASRFVKQATTFTCNVTLTKGDIEVNGKSIMGILTLACEKGSKVTIACDGPDEKKAMTALTKILEGKD